jgi:outer membrane receptor protein involved in Fe transport
VRHKAAHAGLAAALFILVSAAGAAAQTPAPAAPPEQAPRPAAATDTTANEDTADEDFELDIVSRRITEQDFLASTSVATGDSGPGGLNLRIGAAVRASDIDVQLRNVRGRVRFRASLEPVLRLLGPRRAPAAPAP